MDYLSVYSKNKLYTYIRNLWNSDTCLEIGERPVIQKPVKPDYTVLKAYKPISSLPTISMGLEKLIVR
jgi:hypothetical protein